MKSALSKSVKFLQSWCGLFEEQETQWSHELVGCEGFKGAQSSIHWLLEFEVKMSFAKVRLGWSWNLVIVSVRGEGLSGSQGFQEFPTTTTERVETTRYCIVLTFDCFALWAGCCIDKTHRCSHGQAMHASSPSTIQFFSLLPYCCVNINGVPALAIINKYEGGGFAWRQLDGLAGGPSACLCPRTR